MPPTFTNAQLAALTGFTDLDRLVDDPARLETQICLISSKIGSFAPGCPLRFKVAADMYRERAVTLLERVVESA